MVWTTPKTFAVGAVLAAADLNTHLRDNLNETSVAKSAAAGDLTYATGANALIRLPIATNRQVLAVNTAGTAPVWSEALIPNTTAIMGGAANLHHLESGNVTGTSGIVSFTVAFSIAPNVVATPNNATVTPTIKVFSITTTGFEFQVQNFDPSGVVYWIAEGSNT